MPPDNVRPKRGSFHSRTVVCVRELIDRDQREQRVQQLHKRVEEGLASGPTAPDTPKDWAAVHAIACVDLE